MIVVDNLYKSFEDKAVLRGVSLEIFDGETMAIIGRSGSGKSVLMKHIVGLLTPDTGRVLVDGVDINNIRYKELRRVRKQFGVLFQGGALFDSMTVYEQLDFYLRRHTGLTPEERAGRIEETLSWVNLRQTAPQYPAELSGGQRKRIGLARAIILQPEILLYDEPTTGLDPVSVRTVSELIVRLRDERGITSIAITHDLLCAEIIADEVHFLHEGEIIASGSLEALRRSDHPVLRNFFGA